jgi:excisionase family DNA binding protein
VSATIHELPSRAPRPLAPDRYLNAAELADYLGVCTRTISRMVREGCPSHSFGRRLRRFRLAEVEDWLERRAA